jgi:2-methylcitrate dehydratase
MFDGDLNNESYSVEKLRDPRILAFMRKITVKEDSTFAPPRGSAPPIRIVATLTGGQRVTHQVEKMPGFAGQPMSRVDIERKFLSNIGKRWPNGRTEHVLNSLWSLERQPDARSLLSSLTV